jgi:hypothetical protein
MYGRLPVGKIRLELRRKQDAAAVMYPALVAGQIPAGPDGIR